ncbi:NAD(P)-binding protein [Massarina eburnea CBS 473.64]|uniref:NAD(P)-binding protein n=1 Tax=Massarina eburnea CBS 473.64 TaxID=1395130 RepID=A0A6A6RGK3_9PLEO|nr:NAD(P)-binding protein [Massarina eburnea CBS 473.64]
MSGTKTITVVGATGSQGGSVANVFSNLPEWHVRGLTRDLAKPSSLICKESGVELIAGDLTDISSLKKAFAAANVIFGATDFWQHVQDPKAHFETQSRRITVNEVAYEREVQ